MVNIGIVGTGQIFDLNVLGYLNNEDAIIVAKIQSIDDKISADGKRSISG